MAGLARSCRVGIAHRILFLGGHGPPYIPVWTFRRFDVYFFPIAFTAA